MLLFQQIKHAFKSAIDTKLLLDMADCTELLNHLETSSSSQVKTKIQSYIERFESTIPSFERIFYDWKLYRSSYPDIVEPLLANVSQFLYGLKLKLYWSKREFLKWQHKTRFNADLEQELINLAELPSLNENVDRLDKHVDNYTGNKMGRLMEYILDDERAPHIRGKENLRLLKCGIQECYNQCVVNAKNNGVLDIKLLNNFNQLVEIFIDLWNRQQEKKEHDKQDAESLYKTRTKCDDKPEAEQLQDELKELFPNYHVIDFHDLEEKKLSDSEPETQTQENIIDIITDDDLIFVVDLNSNLYKNFIKAEWLAPECPKNICPDFVSPLMEKFKLIRRVMDNYANYFRYTMDSKLSTSLAVLLEVSRRYGAVHELVSDESYSPSKTITKNDFYRSSDVEEVKSCYHVLEELKVKVNELLAEWPDQPTLKMILTVIDRILSFDITSPVSRFLAGFDILLAKCHEWEEVAHHGVSLIQITPNLTNQIITWRKLELSRWKDLLNNTFENLKKPPAKWWLYMYNLMNQYIRERKVTDSELIDTLQKFVTKSTIVEFYGRLEIIFEFHCHAVTLPPTQESKSFINILWNIYYYYSQFSASINSKLKELRTPIEKKLKDYVKIVKWKDVSYWSIKDTVDKSHKILHKLIREYKEVLLQPVTSYLINPVSDNPESVGIWDRPQRQNPKTYHYTLDADSYIVKASVKDLPYLTKARKICKETIFGTNYPDLVKSLDSLVTDVIETSSRLRNLEVDTTLPKEKQKSQAKNIIHQKHRALADLFQTLSKMGLSYKTGLMDSKLKNLTDEFKIPPIDLAASFNYLGHNRVNNKILTIWDSCEPFYYRCLLRQDVLETALLTPDKGLGMQNSERCQGFAAALVTFCQQQKKDLINATRLHYYLLSYLRQMREGCENSSFISSKTLSEIQDALTSLNIVIGQIKLILNSCPEKQTFENQLVNIPLLEPESNRLKYKHDDQWNLAVKSIDIITSLSLKLNNCIQKSKATTPCADYELLSGNFVPFNNKEQLFGDIQKLVGTLYNLQLIFDPIKSMDCLEWLANSFEQIIEDNDSENRTEEPGSSVNFDLLLDEFTKNILLVFQNLYKKYRDTSIARQENNEEDDEMGIQDNHLKTLVMQNLSADIESLELKKILNLSQKVVKVLFGSDGVSDNFRHSTMQCLPLFEQVLQLAQYFITQQVAAYRTTCKLTSILLNIFIDLASKGFCIPPELSDEIDKEGMSKPSDGMGLGEGQGERDVSDKIESEDQLDDAQPAGQEKENNEDPDCNEEDKGIEMSEDFDSKLQDKKPAGEDEDEEQSDNSDAEEQMGETEKGADQLDQEIWGDDKEEGNEGEEESEQKEDDGQGGKKDGEDQLGAKDEIASKEKNKNQDPSEEQDEEESGKNKKDINEMNEPEFDDEQTDPYHGNQQELPEPEPMDLPDDLQLDEGEEKDGEQPEENPFDIDDMKDQKVPEDKSDDANDTNKEEKQNDEEKDFSSDDEDITKRDGDDLGDESAKEDNEDKGLEQEKEEEVKESQEGDEGEENDESPTNVDESALDQNPTNQDNVEAMEVDDADASDKTQATESKNIKSDQPIEETCQEDKPDKEGVGQSQMDQSESGHSVQSSAAQEAKSLNKEQEKDEKRKEKPGESDSKRSLGDVNQEVKKRLKTMDARDNDQQKNENLKDENTDTFQHIKEATEEAKTQALDAATKEQAEEQNKEATHQDDKTEEDNETEEGSKSLAEEKEEMDVDVVETENEKPVKNESSKEKVKNKKQHPDGDIMEDIQDVEIEGEIVKTSTVPRGGESSHHTQYQLLQDKTAEKLTQEEINSVRTEVEKQLSSWKSAPTSVEAELAWQKISSVTSSLAQDLSEQLRLVLEPTQASHLRGDFRTGRRINMRKVIPYIASQFRKDKIWLRRTKPSKREYQIVLAIDDSSSMADNHSKELAFESVALISKALSLLESGQLSVVSFGEATEVHHKLAETFTDHSGVQLLQKFQFAQQKTCIGKLVDFVTEMFDQSDIHASIPNAKLLLIVSDGRGVFSEGKTYVTQAVRRAKLANIFVVFVIIDSPENKNSILDIRSTVFKDGKFLGMQSYMDEFPFTFYMILRDINALPGVLSDALMQWFEMVTSQQ